METKVMIMAQIIIKDKSHKDQEIQFKWKEFLSIKILLKFHIKTQKKVHEKSNKGQTI